MGPPFTSVHVLVNAASASISPNWTHGSSSRNRAEALMWKWIKRRKLIARHLMTPGAPAAEHLGMALRRVAKVSGKYAPLHEYLENRYADSVVLSFGQIEDLLGSALPDTARARPEWWTSTDSAAAKSSCSD